MFYTTIDMDPELSNIEKLQYLRTFGQRPALDAIKSLDISSANYLVALDLLNKRYSNKSLCSSLT